MDNDPIALMLQFGFLAVLYLFLLLVARSAVRDLARHDDDAMAAEAPPVAGTRRRRRKEEAGPDLRAGVDPRLEVVAALGLEPGSSYDIGESLTLGRADTAEVKIDDPFASSAHARVFPRGQFMYIEDMGSTNGTFLNGRQLRRPEQLKPSDSVRIGETEYRYQE
ncbi:MAG: FHA domain-containing protein [Thermoleophilaceae bacterium]